MTESKAQASGAAGMVGEAGTLAEALEILGAQGAGRTDPARWHLALAMARRAQSHTGAARHLIDARLADLVSAFAASFELAPARASDGRRDHAPKPGPLAELVARTNAGARRAPETSSPHEPNEATRAPTRSSPGARGRPAIRDAAPTPSVEPPGRQYFRRTWTKLNADLRLAQSRASLPANAGPLNSHHLVHRALTALHELAPGYCEQFIAHVDDLLWIEGAADAASDEPPASGRGEGERKTAARVRRN